MNDIDWSHSRTANLPEKAAANDRAAAGVIADLPTLKSCHRTETILLVEDDPAMREMTCELLRRNGYQVFTADSESQALQIWERFGHQIDLLLADMLIPHRATGLDLAKKLQRRKPSLKVVFTSGFGKEIGNGDPVFESEHFLQKPYSSDALLEIVSGCLEVSARTAGRFT